MEVEFSFFLFFSDFIQTRLRELGDLNTVVFVGLLGKNRGLIF